MADLGLILGAALAGGVAGAGGAAKDALQSQQKYMQQDDLIHTQNELDEQKQLRIQEANHQFLNQQQQNSFAHDTDMQSNLFDHQTQEGDANRKNVLDNTTLAGQNAKDLEAMREVSERALEATRSATSLQVAHMAHMAQSMQVGADGTIYSVGLGEDGKPQATQLKDASGNPLKGVKDVPASTQMALKVLTDQATILQKNGDEAGAADATAKAARLLNGESLTDIMQTSNAAMPNKDQIDYFTKHPDTYTDFARKFPMYIKLSSGSATQPAPGTTGTTPNPFSTGTPGAAPLPGGADPGAGTNAPALVNGNIPTAPAAPAASAGIASNGYPTVPPAPPKMAVAGNADKMGPPATLMVPPPNLRPGLINTAAAFQPKPGVLDATGNGLFTQR